ncbi:MAG: GTP-binding protein [Ethanoligenens sp.]
MQFITVSGPPSSGKTSVILRVLDVLETDTRKIGIVKFDCLSTTDKEKFQARGLAARVLLSKGICPDHYFASHVEEAVHWGVTNGYSYLFSESAGLCNRCSPHIKTVMAICVIDCLSGVNTPKKIGPMLKYADAVVITKGDIVSQAEREVFAAYVGFSNPNAELFFVNGITGQGAFDFASFLKTAPAISSVAGKNIRFPMPAAVCAYCSGQTCISAH